MCVWEGKRYPIVVEHLPPHLHPSVSIEVGATQIRLSEMVPITFLSGFLRSLQRAIDDIEHTTECRDHFGRCPWSRCCDFGSWGMSVE